MRIRIRESPFLLQLKMQRACRRTLNAWGWPQTNCLAGSGWRRYSMLSFKALHGLFFWLAVAGLSVMLLLWKGNGDPSPTLPQP